MKFLRELAAYQSGPSKQTTSRIENESHEMWRAPLPTGQAS
jgi:hypothetical protein